MIDTAIGRLSPLVGLKAACEAVRRPRASHYRAHPASVGPPAAPNSQRPPRKQQPRALSSSERERVLDVLHSDRFVDLAPAEVYATLLDEGMYLCSESTMYRLLRERGETGDRRRHATHPATVKPELVATAPNRVWSWDTKCRRRHLMSYADL
jgi:putative transposase